MNQITKIISLVALLVTTVPSVLYFYGLISLDVVKPLALVGTIVWFIATPIWMGRKLDPTSDQVEI